MQRTAFTAQAVGHRQWAGGQQRTSNDSAAKLYLGEDSAGTAHATKEVNRSTSRPDDPARDRFREPKARRPEASICRTMATPTSVQFQSHDPALCIVARFEAAFEQQVRRQDVEIYAALHEAWEEVVEYHRTIELRPFEVPQSHRVRDTICRLFSLLPDPAQAPRYAARMAAAFFYPACSRTPAVTRAYSHLAMLCHAAVREPGRCDLRFAEVNPRTQATEQHRGRMSFHHAEVSRLLNFLSTWPPEAEPKFDAA